MNTSATEVENCDILNSYMKQYAYEHQWKERGYREGRIFVVTSKATPKK